MINESIKITVLGTNSSNQQMVSFILKKYLNAAAIPFELNEETDVATFLKRGLISVPCIQFGEEFLSIESNGNFNKSLRKAIKHILKTRNFGNMEKLIIPVDFSDVSTNAFMFGHRFATDLGAVIKALHVCLPNSKDLYKASTGNEDYITIRKNRLNDFVAEFDKDWVGDVMTTSLIDSEFKLGFPSDGIFKAITQNDAKMVIMGTTGDSGPLKQWFGSVSTKVMNEATCPVLLVPKNAGYKGVKNVLYAYDDIELDKELIKPLVNFASKFNAALHLIHINDPKSPDPGFYLEELFKTSYPNQKTKFIAVENDDFVKAIDAYAFDNDIDIIAMGSKNKSFFDRIFQESMTKKMALHSKLPLLILKPETSDEIRE
jgi:nucleotide-binding universal stress UspA family protein